MFIVIEFDWDWTVGIDWGKTAQGIRLGFVAIHIVKCKLSHFVEVLSKDSLEKGE